MVAVCPLLQADGKIWCARLGWLEPVPWECYFCVCGVLLDRSGFVDLTGKHRRTVGIRSASWLRATALGQGERVSGSKSRSLYPMRSTMPVRRRDAQGG